MKRLYFSLFATILAVASLFASDIKSLDVVMSDNSHVFVPILEGTKIYPHNNSLKLSAPNFELRFEKGSFKSFSFSESEGQDNLWTSINDISATNGISIFTFENNELNISSLPSNSNIFIATIDGKMIYSGVHEGSFSYSFENQPKGIYIIRFNNKSIKIVIK